MKPLITLCKACGEIEITHPKGLAARPKVTCSEGCARVWSTARSNASRAKSSAVDSLQEALRHLSRVKPLKLQQRLAEALAELQGIKPADLAVPPSRPVPHLREEPEYLEPIRLRDLRQ
jgi:hypothetical protein